MYCTIFTIGKAKDIFFQQATKHYLTLLQGYGTCTLIPLPDQPLMKSVQPETILKKEAAIIQKSLLPGHITVILDVQGKQYDSGQFAAWLAGHRDRGNKLQFVIGGPYGLSEDIKAAAQERLALSSFTLPHQLATLVLLEQLYRAGTIIRGKKYHY